MTLDQILFHLSSIKGDTTPRHNVNKCLSEIVINWVLWGKYYCDWNDVETRCPKIQVVNRKVDYLDNNASIYNIPKTEEGPLSLTGFKAEASRGPPVLHSQQDPPLVASLHEDDDLSLVVDRLLQVLSCSADKLHAGDVGPLMKEIVAVVSAIPERHGKVAVATRLLQALRQFSEHVFESLSAAEAHSVSIDVLTLEHGQWTAKAEVVGAAWLRMASAVNFPKYLSASLAVIASRMFRRTCPDFPHVVNEVSRKFRRSMLRGYLLVCGSQLGARVSTLLGGFQLAAELAALPTARQDQDPYNVASQCGSAFILKLIEALVLDPDIDEEIIRGSRAAQEAITKGLALLRKTSNNEWRCRPQVSFAQNDCFLGDLDAPPTAFGCFLYYVTIVTGGQKLALGVPSPLSITERDILHVYHAEVMMLEALKELRVHSDERASALLRRGMTLMKTAKCIGDTSRMRSEIDWERVFSTCFEAIAFSSAEKNSLLSYMVKLFGRLNSDVSNEIIPELEKRERNEEVSQVRNEFRDLVAQKNGTIGNKTETELLFLQGTEGQRWRELSEDSESSLQIL